MCELLVFGWEYNITLVCPHLLYSDEHLNDGPLSLGQQKLIGRNAIFGSDIFRVGLISWHLFKVPFRVGGKSPKFQRYPFLAESSPKVPS